MDWLIYFLKIIAVIRLVHGCNREPQGTTADKSPVDDNYMISIAGNPTTYIPGQKYNVSLIAYNGATFTGFMLGVENENGDSMPIEKLGLFEIIDLVETRFSPRCANLIENTNSNIKTRIEVTWVAPSRTGSGCIYLRATVIQHRDIWFMDDGFLTKKLCEEEVDDINVQPAIVNPCCACEEAKYELTFEGKWSRHTHPKDFPANSWRTRFSDIIGASHTIDYSFWKYGELASEGLREVAEHGSTLTLESELKDKSNQIRTIIKARGISYPNVTSKTFAVFRVDSNHHLISLVSMIDPSPDWIVGVSGLELCLNNCSWVESKVHNLYPWDAGTDSGPSYMSADQPQVPPDVIRRIKSNFPNDPRSPFYDPTGAPMKPLATLHINRRRLYEKTCNSSDSENEPPECATHPYSRWGECSAKCGPGKQHRQREFKNPEEARRAKCRKKLREERDCTGQRCGLFNEEQSGTGLPEAEMENPIGGPSDPECATSDWSEWSACSVTCGIGVRTHTRYYLNRSAKRKCQKVYHKRLQETEKCKGTLCSGDINGQENENGNAAGDGDGAGGDGGGADADADAGADPDAGADGGADDNGVGAEAAEVDGEASAYYGNIDYSRRFDNFQSYSQKREDYIPPECGVSPWSNFSPCLAPCGQNGKQRRERKVWNLNEAYGVKPPNSDGTDPCRHIKRVEEVNCTTPSCDVIVPSYCYEPIQISPCRDSDVSNYWYYDHMSDQCAIFWTDRCDKNRNKFNSTEICEEMCRQPRIRFEKRSGHYGSPNKRIDCLVSEWQAHACNATCSEGIQIKTRRVLRSPKYGGKPCPKHLVRLDKCYQRCDDIYSVGSGFFGSERRRFGGFVKQNMPQEKDDCQYSEWSAWTPCTATCGDKAVRQKTRTLINNEFNYKCKDRVRIEKCKKMPCLLTNNDDNYKW